MKKNLLFVLTAFTAFSLTFTSCKKDDKEDDKPIYEAPKIGGSDGKIVEVNSSLSGNSNEYAQQCAGYLEQVNGLTGYFDMFTPPSNAQTVSTKSVGTSVWTWSAEGVTVWLTFIETATKYTWTYDIDLQGTGRFTYIYAEETKDGSDGLLRFYGGYNTTATAEYTWHVASDGTADVEYLFGEGGQSLKIVVKARPDGSGFVDYYTTGTLFYHLVWNADGSGSWVYYYGDQNMSGTWS